MMGDDIKHLLSCKVKLVLVNKNFYSGVLEEINDSSVKLLDINRKHVIISLDAISEVVEAYD